MTDVLADICAEKRIEVAARRAARSLASIMSDARRVPPVRPFAAALDTAARSGFGLIAEIKKASPSKGLIRADFDPPVLAKAYKSGGATCLSVLTQGSRFQGDDSHLVVARAAVDLPVLRKDFTVDPYQVVEARALGADCILIILAAVDDTLAGELEDTAIEYGMDVLIEVHDEDELARAVKRRSRLIGVNNRNLKTLTVDIATTEKLAPLAPKDARIVGESGLGSRRDLDRLAAVGVRCFLVGESLMREPDVAAATRILLHGSTARERASARA